MRKLMSALLAATMLFAAGCGTTSTAPTSETPKPVTETPAAAKPFNLVVAQGADIVSLDPHKANDQPSSRVTRQIYDTLIDQTEKLELAPGLAESWKQIDEKTWEFKLRQNVKFHNGETFKASDVKFTFGRLVDPATKAPGAFIMGQLDKVEVVDDYTVRLVTKAPFAPILAHLAHTATSILSEKAVTTAGDKYAETPVGTGPFKFVNWTTGAHVDLARFDGYWGEKAKADTVRFRAIKEGSTRAIELETGAVDIVYTIEPQDYERMKAENKVQLLRDKTLSTNYIGFNTQKAPYDKVEVRQAINHALNVDEIVKHVLLNIGEKATSPISNLVWGANTELKGYAFDVNKAKELLTKAGLPNGFKTTIWTNDNPTRMKIAEVVQSQLKKINIDVTIEVVEWGKYLADTAAGKHDMFILGWVAVTGDADYGLFPLFHSSQFGSPGNRTMYKNDKVDQLLDKGRTTGNQADRLAAYKEAQQIILQDAPWLFLNIGEEVNGLKKGVTNFVAHPAGHHRLKNVIKQ